MPQRQYKFPLLLAIFSGWALSFLILGPSLYQQSAAQEIPVDPRFGAVEAFWDTSAAVEAGVAWERILFQWSQL